MNAIREKLATGRWFDDLPEPFQDALVTHGVARTFAAGAVVFSRGDACDGLYAVLDGAVRISSTTDAGKEAVLTRIDPPAWFGEIAVFDGDARTHDAVCDVESRLLHVAQPAIMRILADDPTRWRNLALLVTHKLRLAFLLLEDSATLPLTSRLAHRLGWLAANHGELRGHTAREVAVSQEQLASMLAASRQSVNQALKELEAKKLVRVSYGKIEILDVDELKRA